MLGDMYCATVAYNDENIAEASPLGSIEVRYSEVTQFEEVVQKTHWGKILLQD